MRKLVPAASIAESFQRCSSPGWKSCKAAREHCAGHEEEQVCPFLCRTTVQFCKAAPLSKFVPLNEAICSRCNTSAHRYCEIYLERARGTAADAALPPDEIEIPEHFSFSRNHLWIDADEDGGCHVGIDGFLARAIGEVEKITYDSSGRCSKPAVAIRCWGVDHALIFPRRMTSFEVNSDLMAHPERLTRDPYGTGWLFERIDNQKNCKQALGGCDFVSGAEARNWMRDELARFSRFLSDLPLRQSGPIEMADGGIFAPGVIRHLLTEDRIFLLNTFFSNDRGWCEP
ncbi:MAG: hypothetical protein R6V85_03900 [Polyangia bacterium]